MSKSESDVYIAHDVDETGNRKTADIAIDENVDFSGMLLSEPVLRGLRKAGFKRPSPIQLKAIPPARCGVDLIVQAKSGTGKTCVFVVIALETVVLENDGTQVLILAPTREIARQSYENLLAIGSCLPGLKCACFIGGVKNDKVASKHCHIVVGSPGRVCQLIQDGELSIDGVRLFVLDEADKLMDESYQENVNWIFSRLPMNKQLIVLSATFPRQLDEFLSKYMKTPQMVKLDSTDVQLIGIKQYVYTINCSPGEDWLQKKINGLHWLLSKATFSQCLIFCNFQDKADLLCAKLKEFDWPVEFIAAQLNQHQRLNVMKRLKKFQCRILVSTDLTARGIDAEHVNLVINFDVPFVAETYFHRIGRAGRFGGYGAAITILCGWQTELSYYQMADENKFHAKTLPKDFPLDVVANESFFDALPPLKIPDLAAFERKAAVKNARKNVTLQSEDFYGKLMKTYGYKLHRKDPQTFKFNFTPAVNGKVEENIHKYDRDVFEHVLKETLKINGIAVNVDVPVRKVQANFDVPLRTILTNGEIRSDVHQVEQNNLENVSNTPAVTNPPNCHDDVQPLEKNESSVTIESPNSTEDVQTNATEDRQTGDISCAEVTFESNMLEQISSDQIESPPISVSPKAPEVAPPKEIQRHSQLTYSDAFDAAYDNYLCELYGGFSLHYERCIRSKDTLRKVAENVPNACSPNVIKVAENVPNACSPKVIHEPAKLDILAKNKIVYSREQMLVMWRQVAETFEDPKQCDWFTRVESLGIYVPRCFSVSNYSQTNGNSNRSTCSPDLEDDKESEGGQDCWTEYRKVLEKYKCYVESYSGKSGDSLNDYSEALKVYERYVGSNLVDVKNVMEDYCARMLSE